MGEILRATCDEIFTVKAIYSDWLSLSMVPMLMLVLTGSLLASSRQEGRSVHKVIKPVPSLGSIAPSSAPLGSSRVTMTVTGDGFVDGASLVRWDGKSLPTTFESTSQLKAHVSAARLTSPGDFVITVFNPEPGGGTSTSVTFTVSDSQSSLDLFVPVVVSVAGLNDSFFTSELTLTNKSTTPVTLDLQYTAAVGYGTGRVSNIELTPGQQIEPDAIEYLRSLGIPIPASGSRVGTLMVRAFGTSSPSDVAVTVRTSSLVPEGRAGLSYTAVPLATGALTGPSYLCGLQQTATDRSNVAVQHAGLSGNITLRLTVFSGNVAVSSPQLVAEVTLPPGGFKQFNGILQSEGLMLDNGYVKIEKVFGEAPYYAYAVINDQASSDSSFVAPVRANWMAGSSGLTLPVIVEAGEFRSELIVANWSSDIKTITFRFVDSDIANGQLSFSMDVGAGSQRILGDFVEHLRELGYSADLPRGRTYAGPLMATVNGNSDGLFLGSRTSKPGGGGKYGVFCPAVPIGTAFSTGAWLYGLQQDSDDRTDLALLTTSSRDNNGNVYDIDLYDGNRGLKVKTLTQEVPANQWVQIGMILGQAGITQGYAHVKRMVGDNDFITYAVIKDGEKPNERSGDGAFIPGVADSVP